jgi:hypothetical protein
MTTEKISRTSNSLSKPRARSFNQTTAYHRCSALMIVITGLELSYFSSSLEKTFFVEYLYYYVRWCASLQPPTICAKSSSADNALQTIAGLSDRMVCYQRPTPVPAI